MKPKLLIVEDDATVREMLALVLSGAGFDVVTAPDGQAGLDRAWCERPDLILTDLEMPNLDGIQMILGLRREPELQAIPVLVLSAVPQGTLRQAISAGAAEALQKPVQICALIELIRQILGHTPPSE
ncbi:MAG TPA: response regulator [Blastocatellia bacterium]|nr:response regulator [Blastocatellia bacterium]